MVSQKMEQETKIPKVAIIIATHNYGHFIKDAIQSVVLQDYPNKVIYIVDDASTDDTENIIYKLVFGPEFMGPVKSASSEEYELNLLTPINGLYFKLKKCGGPSRARNFAIKHALENGCHIIAILDADDCMKQMKLSKAVLKIMEDPERIAGVYGDYLHLNTETGAITYESKWSYDINKLRQECIVHSGTVLNGAALKQVGLYREDMRTCEDFELYRRLAQRFLFVHIPEDLTIVRVQPMNSTVTVSKELWAENYRKAMSVPL